MVCLSGTAAVGASPVVEYCVPFVSFHCRFTYCLMVEFMQLVHHILAR